MCTICDDLEGAMDVAKTLGFDVILNRLRVLFTKFQKVVQDSPKDQILAALPRPKIN